MTLTTRYGLKRKQNCEGEYAIYRVEDDDFGSGGRGQTVLARVLRIKSAARSRRRSRLRQGMQVVIKTPRLEEDRTPLQLREFQASVSRALEYEMGALGRLAGLTCVPAAIDDGVRRVELQNGEVLRPRFIVEEFIDGQPLDAYVGKFGEARIPVAEWFRLARALAEGVKEIHARGVCHRDIWPKNILIRRNEPVFIDFGEAEFRQVVELPPGWPPHAHEYMAPEYRSGPRWPTRRADIYSLGGALFYMATSTKPPEELPDDDEELKQEVVARIQRQNAKLLDDNWGIGDIIVRCLRRDRSRRTPNAAALLRDIACFEMKEPPLPDVRLKRIDTMLRGIPVKGSALFRGMMGAEMEQIEERVRDMKEGIVDVSGSHEELTTGAIQYLAALREGDEYLAVSVADFWRAGNMGIRGRYLSMNRLVAQRGVVVRRVFLISDEEANSPEVIDILKAHRDASEGVQGLEVKVKVLAPQDVAIAIQSGTHSGTWIHGNEIVRLTPVYDEDRRIRTLRFRRMEEEARVAKVEFDRVLAKAVDIREWLLDRGE